MEEKKVPRIPPSFEPVVGYPNYYINRLGEIISVSKNGKITHRKIQLSHRGYWQIGLSKSGVVKTFYIHRLMAKVFLDYKEELVVNHIDGKKTNNNISNLEMITEPDNKKHAQKNGLLRRGTNSSRSKLNNEIVMEIRNSILSGPALAKKYDTTRSNIWYIRNMKAWKHV